jgi:hypothetical protein
MVNQLPVPIPSPAPGETGSPALPVPENKVVRPPDNNAPPTEPIINNQKYFPQLNRF